MKRPLLSVAKTTEAGIQVYLGENNSFVKNKKTGQITNLRRERNVWMLDLTHSSSSFSSPSLSSSFSFSLFLLFFLIYLFFYLFSFYFFLFLFLFEQFRSIAAVKQIRVGALSPMPTCLGIGGHPSGSRQGHPQYIGGQNTRKAVGGPFGSDSRYTANMVAEEVVKNRKST